MTNNTSETVQADLSLAAVKGLYTLAGVAVDPDDPLKEILGRLKKQKEVVVSGYAGTGKTTLVKGLIGVWSGAVTLLAPTGRAALRLSTVTQHAAATIHSTIYQRPETDELDEPTGWMLRIEPIGGPGSLFVVDESSMVDQTLRKHLLAVLLPGTKVVWLGDPMQLAPVEGATGPKLSAPDILLTRVWRQALDSGIMRLATWMRSSWTNPADLWGELRRQVNGTDVFLLESKRITPQDWTYQARQLQLTGQRPPGWEAVLLVWRNKTRHFVNAEVRRRFGRDPMRPEATDRLLVMSNHGALGAMNGQLVNLTSAEQGGTGPELGDVSGRLWECTSPEIKSFFLCPETMDIPKHGRKAWSEAVRDESAYFQGVYRSFLTGRSSLHERWKHECAAWAETGMASRATVGPARSLVMADWGEALTAHKSQGSEWDTVGIVGHDTNGLFHIDRREGTDDAMRWWYTAVTRARSRLIVWTR